MILCHALFSLSINSSSRSESMSLGAPTVGAKYKSLLAEQLAKVLVKKNMGSISDYALHCLVYEIAKTTELDDGSLCPPPDEPPPEPEPEPTPAVSSLQQSFQPQTGSGSVSSMV